MKLFRSATLVVGSNSSRDSSLSRHQSQLNSLLKDLATITETESCTTEECVNIDSGNQVHTLESTDWEAELHSCINDQDITLDDTSQGLPEPSVPSDKDVIRALEVLKLYAFHNPSVLGFNHQ